MSATVHYHRDDAGDELRVCSLDDELERPTFWVPEPSAHPAQDQGDWPAGWTDVGYTTDEERRP